MRSLKKNMQKIRYATYSDQVSVYDRDVNGNIIYDLVDGEAEPREIAKVAGYNDPVIFYANIAMSGGEAAAREFGVDASEYEAVMVTADKSLPIDELTRIWVISEVCVDDNGAVDGDSADYSVLMVKPSLNGVKYLLKKVAK